MQFRFADDKLGRLYTETSYAAGYGRDVVKAFRKVMGWVKDAPTQQDFYRMKSLHYEKLKGKRSHQRSMRLNDQYRLIVALEEQKGKTIVIAAIEKHYE